METCRCRPIIIKLFVLAASVCISVYSFAQCQFSITRGNNTDQCLYAEEEVVWRNAVGVAIAGNSITKTSTTTSWSNSGALSFNTVGNNGWASTVIGEINTERVFGLASAPSSTPAFGRSQFGFFFSNAGRFSIYEGSAFRGSPPGHYLDNTYRSGDIFKIHVVRGVVMFYQNSTLVFTSSATPVTPLTVEATLNSGVPQASLQDVRVANGSDGTFVTNVSNPGVGATYQWYQDNNPIPGATGVSYSDAGISQASRLSCRLVTGTGGCLPAGSLVSSNSIRFQTVPASAFSDVGVMNDPVSFACLSASEPVIFKDVVNVVTTGNAVTKIKGSTSSWDGGAFSVNRVVNNGSVEAAAAQTNAGIFFGLSPANSGTTYTTIAFAFYLRSDARVEIFEAGVSKKLLPDPYTTSTHFTIALENGVIKYYVDNELEYISGQSASTPLYADISMSTLNGKLRDLIVTNATTGSFKTFLSLSGAAPTYQWKRNGAVVPLATGDTHIFSVIADDDLITCDIGTGLIGCSPVTAALIPIHEIPFRGTAYISAGAAPVSCVETVEDVIFSDHYNVTTTGNVITKFQGTDGSWDAGATSLNKVINNGYAKMRVTQLGTARIFGLSSDASLATHTSPSNTTIQYGILLRSENQFEVYEPSVPVSINFGTFGAGDEFTIKVDNGVVRYYRDTGSGDQLFYSSTIDPMPLLPLVVDVSLNTINGTVAARLDNIVIGNGGTGVFQAHIDNMGVAPVFQWKVGSANDGGNTPTYSNNSLSEGQVITCSITPDLPGCAIEYASNAIRVNKVGGALSPTTTWTGALSSLWSAAANWTNGVPTGITKVVIPSGTPAPNLNLASCGVYDLTVHNGAALSISGANSLVVFGQWINQGTITANAGTVSFRACATNKNTISSDLPAGFMNVIVENINGVEFKGQYTIHGNLSFVSGVVGYGGLSDLITIADDATVSGASDISHVNGKVKKRGNDGFTFPVGKNGLYRPLSISAPQNAIDEFTVEYFTGDAKMLPGYSASVDPSFWSVSGCEHWTMERTGTSTVKTELSWNPASNCPNPPYITDPADLRVAYWNGSSWANAGNGGTTGDASQGTIVSASNINSYHALTLASTTSANPLPVELSAFDGEVADEGVVLRWNTLTESNSEKFIIQRSGTGHQFQDLDSLEAAGESNVLQQYRYTDTVPVKGRNYYRIALKDYDGGTQYSNVVYALFETRTSFSMHPNPVKQGQKVFVKGASDGLLVDLYTRQKVRVVSGEAFIDTSALSPGVYVFVQPNGDHQKLIVYR